jgi:hypothetical protein
METSEDPQVVASTEAAEVIIPADPRLLLVPKSTTKHTESSHTVDNDKIRRESLNQKLQQSPSEVRTQIQPPPQQSPITAEAILDEEKIQPTIDMSINPADVLSGRGKQAFNHGTLWLLLFFRISKWEKFGYIPIVRHI